MSAMRSLPLRTCKHVREPQGAEGRAVVFQDFKASSLASGAPVAFIGAPIMRRANAAMGGAQEDVRAGYAIIRFSPSIVDRVFSDRNGLGDTWRDRGCRRSGLLRTNAPLVKTPTAEKGGQRSRLRIR